MGDPADFLLRLCLSAPLFLFALTVHEYAHAWMAKQCGDPTAEQEGRLTLDPVAHIDPVGALMFVLSAAVGYGFGWAKPVPVRLGNCAEPLKAMLKIAAAGPISNLLQALAALAVLMLLGVLGAPLSKTAFSGVAPILDGEAIGMLGIIACLVAYYFHINVILMLFNLVPVPPLDGGRILISVLPYRMARQVAMLEQYGFIVILVAFRGIGMVLGLAMTVVDLGLLAMFGALGMG